MFPIVCMCVWVRILGVIACVYIYVCCVHVLYITVMFVCVCMCVCVCVCAHVLACVCLSACTNVLTWTSGVSMCEWVRTNMHACAYQRVLMSSPGQAAILHVSSSKSSPAQYSPPNRGVGLEHSRVRVLFPVPQLSEQFVQSPHVAQPPLTSDINNTYCIHSI
jgi:hypothetical protein